MLASPPAFPERDQAKGRSNSRDLEARGWGAREEANGLGQVGQEHGPACRVSTSCGLLTLPVLMLAPGAWKSQCKTAARPRMRMGHSPRPDATPYLDREMSPPLPTASNHYSAWDPLNMRRHVTLFDPGPVPREGGSIYINVWRVGGEGLTEWREGGGQGSATPGILTVVGSAVSFQSCWQLLH